MDSLIVYQTHADAEVVAQLLPSFRNQNANLRVSPCYVHRLKNGEVAVLVQGPVDEAGRMVLDRLIQVAEKVEAKVSPHKGNVERRDHKKAPPPRPINRTRNR